MFKHGRRGKVNLTYISDDSTRRITFKKRNKGLFKKLNELTTLCDVKACAVVYSPEEERPILFPNDPLDVLDVVSEFRKLSMTEQKRKMLDQEDYLNERIKKTKDQLSRLKLDNRDRRLSQLMYEYLLEKSKTFESLSISDLRELNKLIDRHLREIEHRVQTFDVGMPNLSIPPSQPLMAKGSDQFQAMNPPVVGPTGPLPSQFMAGESYFQGPVVGNNQGFNNNNNNMNMEANPMVLDQWFFEMLRNSQEAGGSSSTNMPFNGSNLNFGPM